MKAIDKKALNYWDEYKKQVFASTYINENESPLEQQQRKKKLEGNPEEWFKFYFPKFAFAEPADFHKAATKRVLGNKRWYEVRAWSRELAKSTRTMMEVMYMVLTGKRFNVLLISNSNDNAERLLKPYKINLETNQRMIHDYGKQESTSDWTGTEFVTRHGVAFRGIGAGQSPRGSRTEEKRIDTILIDDFDTDEECRNPKIVKQKWEWLEQAVIPTVSISGEYTIIFCGNIISKYCCITEAKKKAKVFEVINIRDKNGRSSWPQKNSENDIDDILSLVSYISQQKEYYNNPITKGTVFDEMHYKRLPSLKVYPFMVVYIDPSYKASSKSDYKAAVLIGKHKGEYHIHKAFVQQCTTSKLVEGLVDIKNYVGDQTAIYWYMEEVFLQDIIIKEVYDICEQKKITIPLKGDDRDKPDKFTRIESNLEPLNRNGKLWLNEDEKENPNMQTLDEQFTALEQGSKTNDDGPDAVEGGKWIIDAKADNDPGKIVIGKRSYNSKRY